MNRFKISSIFFFALLLFYFIPLSNKVCAVSTTIIKAPSVIGEEEFVVGVEIEGAREGTNYLRVDLYKNQTNDYFGQTYNGQDWYSGSEFTSYLPVQIVSSTTWTGEIKARVGPMPLAQYSGAGSYMIRIRRYTASGSYSSDEAIGSAKEIEINIATPSSISSPTQSTNVEPTNISVTPISNTGQNQQAVSGIYLWEVMANPDSDQNEWIEIYNNNDFMVSLDNWTIDDNQDSGSAPKTFSLEISKNGFAVYELTSNIFNNSSDTVRLSDNQGNLIDTFDYAESEKDLSFGRTTISDKTFCPQTPSKGEKNNPCMTGQETNDADPEDNRISASVLSQANNLPPSVSKALPKTTSATKAKNYPWLTFMPDKNIQITGSVLGVGRSIKIDKSGQDFKNTIKALSAASAATAFLNIIYILSRLRGDFA